jgi:predicted transcriptional regulator
MSSQLDREVTPEWRSVGEPNRPQSTPSVASPSVGTVLETVFGLRQKELRTYEAIRADPGASTKALSDRLDRDRSNINRSVTQLEDAGLVTRHRRILDSGGYYYANYAAPTAVLEEVVDEALDQWVTEARSTVADHKWEASRESPTES